MTFLRTRCPNCKGKLLPKQRIHPECIDEWAAKQEAKAARKAEREARARAKVDRAQTRARRRALEKISDVEEKCRRIVQKIARIRDRDRGCISCDKPASWDGQWHGSHYRAHGGCSSLQFHLWNINKACWICNKLYSGRRDGYQVGLVQRYGQERLDWLDSQPKSKKFTRDYLERFKTVMGKRLRRMEKRLEKE
jgi:hypothetical protein